LSADHVLFRFRHEKVRGIIGTLGFDVEAVPFPRALRHRDRHPIHENHYPKRRTKDEIQTMIDHPLAVQETPAVYYVFYKYLTRAIAVGYAPIVHGRTFGGDVGELSAYL
jgi:hypothetical protein